MLASKKENNSKECLECFDKEVSTSFYITLINSYFYCIIIFNLSTNGCMGKKDLDSKQRTLLGLK